MPTLVALLSFICLLFFPLKSHGLGVDLLKLSSLNYKGTDDHKEQRTFISSFIPWQLISTKDDRTKFYLSLGAKYEVFSRTDSRYLADDVFSLGGIFTHGLDRDNKHTLVFYPILAADSQLEFLHYDLNFAYKSDIVLLGDLLHFKGLGYRFRRIGGVDEIRHDVQVDFSGKFCQHWQYNLYLPSEISLYYQQDSYYLGGGLRATSLTTRVKDDQLLLKEVGYRLMPFIAVAKNITENYWLEANIGGFGYEKFSRRDKGKTYEKDKTRRLPWSVSLALVHKT